MKQITRNRDRYSACDLLERVPLAPVLGFAGPIDKQRAYNIVNTYSLAFFDQHLEDRRTALLDGLSNRYPEALFETRPP